LSEEPSIPETYLEGAFFLAFGLGLIAIATVRLVVGRE